MSSTARGAERSKDDFYETPGWAVETVLPFLPGTGAVCRIVDPGAGRGAITMVLRQRYPGAAVWAIEKDKERAEHVTARLLRSEGASWGVHGDFHDWAAKQDVGSVDLVVGNPPYNDARRFVESSLRVVGAHGVVAMLLRIAWIAGAKRAGFHQDNPSDLIVLSKRPSFCASFKCSCGQRWTEPAGTKSSDCPSATVGISWAGGEHKVTRTDTDSADYAWFLWGPDGRQRGRVVVP